MYPKKFPNSIGKKFNNKEIGQPLDCLPKFYVVKKYHHISFKGNTNLLIVVQKKGKNMVSVSVPRISLSSYYDVPRKI